MTTKSVIINTIYYGAMASVVILGSVVALTSCTEPFKQPAPASTEAKQQEPKPASKGQLVAIDVGHNLAKFGATSTTGKTEFSYNLNIAKLLKTDLEARGFKALLIGADGQMTGLKERPKVAESANADIFVSIHHDSAAESDIKMIKFEERTIEGTTANYGYSVFVSRKNGENIKLGARIGQGFNDNGLEPTLYHKNKRESLNDKRGLYEFGTLQVLKHANIPAVLVECGVIKNPLNEKELSNPAYQAKIVDSIADGIQHYLTGAK